MIFVPNAFTPNGENPIFKPTLSNVSASNYSFFVMNRWGQIIFETNDPSVGWNGNISNTGILATNDVFLYVINFENEKKIKVNKRGFVTMVK
jgi:gliding motility-associated-like protein